MAFSQLLLYIGIAAVVCAATCIAAAADSGGGGGRERYKIPEPTWAEADLARRVASAETGRKLLQPGIFTPGHTGSTKCNIQMSGTGAKWVLKNVNIKCTTTDAYWKKAPFNGRVLVYAGRPFVNFAKAYPKNFTGIQFALPNEPDFLGPNNAESVMFFVQAGKIDFTGYARNMNVVDWAVTHIENGTDASFTNFTWDSINGVRFPTLAVARASARVYDSIFKNNNCTSITRCHTPGIYITEGARMVVQRNTFTNNRGHLAGAMMITSGALATVANNKFTSNQAVNYGDWAGAIFHDFCDRDSRTKGGISNFINNTFTSNKANGFGGAIRLGSPDGGCPRTAVTNNLFQSNTATLTGGAIHVSYCHGVRPNFGKNKFNSNSAKMFNGQIGFNPLTYPPGQKNEGTGPTPSGHGCPTPTITGSTFTGSAPNFSPPWYFP